MVRAPPVPWRVVLEGRSLTVCEPARAPVCIPFADIRTAREIAWDGFDVPRGWSDTLVLELTRAMPRTVKIPLRDVLYERSVGLHHRDAPSDGRVGDGGVRLVDAVRAHVAVELVLIDSPVDGWV